MAAVDGLDARFALSALEMLAASSNLVINN
jgi:hypothetical protein